MSAVVLGIDVGKDDLHCALLDERDVRSNSFPNSTAGFARMLKWFKNRKVAQVHACLEATGGYGEELAEYLHDRGHIVSIVNPAAVRAFGQSVLSRTKTDKADAALIARFCVAHQPVAWVPPSPAERRLQRLVRRRASLSEMLTQETNRFKAPGSADVRKSIRQHIKFLERQIASLDREIRSLIDDDPTLRQRRDLLESIPGIGPGASSTLLGELPNMSRFKSAKALAAYAGLCPRLYRSGTSVHSSWLSRTGNAQVRRILYWPAYVAKERNPVLKAWAAQLEARGKRPKQILAAVMRRLLILAYGVLKSQRPFDPAFAP